MKKRNDKVKTKINGNVNSNDEVTKLVKITAIIVFVYAAFCYNKNRDRKTKMTKIMKRRSGNSI